MRKVFLSLALAAVSLALAPVAYSVERTVPQPEAVAEVTPLLPVLAVDAKVTNSRQTVQQSEAVVFATPQTERTWPDGSGILVSSIEGGLQAGPLEVGWRS